MNPKKNKKAPSVDQRIIQDLQREKTLRHEFIAGLSHDLRTPLTVAKLTSDLIRRRTQDPSIIKLAKRIALNMDRADRMIRNFLDASHITAHRPLQLKTESVSVHRLLSEIVESFETVYGPRFVYEGEDHQGEWDRDGIERVIENLLSNAIKHGDTNGTITIRSKVSEGDKVHISVHNFGNPIAGDDLRHLFEPLLSHHQPEVIQQGWKIGLTLVKGITEAHGGRAWVESKLDHGTTFSIELPFRLERALLAP